MRVLLSVVILGSVACDVCKPSDDSALDYAADDAWVCRPGAANDACADDLSAAEVHEDGTIDIVAHAPLENPEAACFWVYPTVDLSLTSGVHTDFSNPEVQRRTVVGQAAAFTEVCSVHAPLYRQVTLGVYANRNREERDRCFAIAAEDVKRAFTTFLEEIGEKPFIIGGHSQGGQVTSTIVRDVIEQDPDLSRRMIAAMPIGWGVGVVEASDVGGTFQRTPICDARDETHCVLAFRSVGAANKSARDPREAADGIFFGDVSVCTNPVDDGAPLDAMFTVDTGFVDIPDAAKESGARFALYRDAFSARCIDNDGNALLEITPLRDDSPVDLTKNLFAGDSGTHLLDMQFGQRALAELIKEKINAYVVGR